MKSKYAIEVKNLTKKFKKQKVVNDISFNIPKGEIFSLLGPNGAGKTTTLKMLTTLLKPTDGSIKILGHDTQKEAQTVRSLFGLTSQSSSIDEDLSARENLMIFARLNNMPKQNAKNRTNQLLKQFDLINSVDKKLSNFSGGMRRRLDLAVSLISQPAIIFLDEPTTGLDPRTRIQMWDEIKKLVNNGSTIVLTTQYLEEADKLADHVAMLDHGKIVGFGTPTELKKNVGNSKLILKFNSSLDAKQAKIKINSVLSANITLNNNYISIPLVDLNQVTTILNELTQAKLHFIDIDVKQPSMDDVFFSMTVGKIKRSFIMISSKCYKKYTIQNILTIAYRNLLKTLHNPDELLDVIVQHVLFMLMFAYLFGGAITGNVHDYLPIIVPGILMYALISAASGSGTQISENMHSGIYNRFKSLPISNIAPLAGQLFADILRLLVASIASIITGYLLGWRPVAGFKWLLIVLLLDIFLGWVLSWIFAFYGLIARSSTMVESVSLMTMLILIFLSNAFVPVKTLPKFMQFIVHLNPVTYVINSSRAMLNNGIWTNSTWIVLGCGILIIATFAPMTVIAYKNKNQ